MYVLTNLFGNYYQSRIIETLLENVDEELTIPEIIEMANTSRGSTYKYMEYLEREKIVKNTRKIGKTKLFQLNVNHPTSKSLLLLEHEIFTSQIEKLVGKSPKKEKKYSKNVVITLKNNDGRIGKQYLDGHIEVMEPREMTKWKNMKKI